MLRACYLLLLLSSSFAICALDKVANVTIYADTITFLTHSQNLSAEGNVVVTQPVNGGTRILHCTKLQFNSLTQTIQAFGYVSLQEADGNTAYADHMTFSADLKQGTLQSLKIVTKDAARFNAEKAEKSNNEHTLTEATYTPCKICEGKSPTWQLKAEKIVHDHQEKTIQYHHVFLELKGCKVFYLPYFYHPDPTVKQKSGFLFPTIGSSSSLGQFITTPYYFAINHDRDVTVTPMIMSKQAPLLMGQYRQRFYNGEGNFSGSITSGSKQKKTNITIPSKTRWHFATFSQLDMSEKNRFIADINRASDTTYLAKYKIYQNKNTFGRSKNLMSTVTFEHYNNNAFGTLKGQLFQTDTPRTTPKVVPHGKIFYISDNFRNKSHIELYGDWLSITRKQAIVDETGKQTHRASAGGAWIAPYISPGGHLWTTTIKNRGDVYYTREFLNNARATDTSKKYTTKSVAYRIFPQATLDWKYPLINSNGSWILEPKAMVVTAPKHFSHKPIPNEDSRTFTLDDTNLFLTNRFDGIDRVDSGSRFVYGINNKWNFQKNKNVHFFVGHTRRLDKKQVVPYTKGENKIQSDYITNLLVNPNDWIIFQNRAAFIPKTLRPRYNEFGISLGKPKISLDLGYVYTQKTGDTRNKTSQASMQIASKLDDNWQISVAQIRNLKKQSGNSSLGAFASIIYQDDCFTCKTSIYRNTIRDRDLQPDTGFLLQFVFKNLGNFTPFTTNEYPMSPLTKLR